MKMAIMNIFPYVSKYFHWVVEFSFVLTAEDGAAISYMLFPLGSGIYFTFG